MSVPKADPRGRFYLDSQYSTADVPMGQTRQFGRLWDVNTPLWDDEGEKSSEGQAISGWARGTIVRRSQPVFMLTQLGPSLDRAGPGGWRPNL